MKSKYHNWHGTIMHQQCWDCGESFVVPYDPCDSNNISKFLSKQKMRKDCKSKKHSWLIKLGIQKRKNKTRICESYSFKKYIIE